MFEIKKEYNEYVSKTFRLPIEIIQRLEVEAQKNNTSLKETIGYLPSEINLYGELTIKEIIEYLSFFI